MIRISHHACEKKYDQHKLTADLIRKVAFLADLYFQHTIRIFNTLHIKDLVK